MLHLMRIHKDNSNSSCSVRNYYLHCSLCQKRGAFDLPDLINLSEKRRLCSGAPRGGGIVATAGEVDTPKQLL